MYRLRQISLQRLQFAVVLTSIMLSLASSAASYMPVVSTGRPVTAQKPSPTMAASWQEKAQSVGLAAALAFSVRGLARRRRAAGWPPFFSAFAHR